MDASKLNKISQTGEKYCQVELCFKIYPTAKMIYIEDYIQYMGLGINS